MLDLQDKAINSIWLRNERIMGYGLKCRLIKDNKENNLMKKSLRKAPRYARGAPGISKGADILPKCAISKRLRYEKQIKALDLFCLLSPEMVDENRRT